MSDTAWADAVGELHREAGGVMQLAFFDPAAGVRLFAAASLGDARSAGMLVAIADCARRIAQAPPHEPMLCLCCPAPIRSPRGVTFALAVPAIDKPHHALGSAICRACAARHDLERRALGALRRLWPDLRELQVVAGPERQQ